MTDEITVTPIRFGSARYPTAVEFAARRGLAADPCTNVRCRSLGFRPATDPPALRCKKCGSPTVQTATPVNGEGWQ